MRLSTPLSRSTGLVVATILLVGCSDSGDPVQGAPRGSLDISPEAQPGIDASLTPLRIVFVPQENPDRLLEGARESLAFLERSLGRKVEAKVTLSYTPAVQAMIDGEADASFLPPLPYILAHARSGAEAVLGEIYAGRSYYHSKIFVRADSGIESLEDLRGKSIVFADEISSSGYLYPWDTFVSAGLIRDPEALDGGFFGSVEFSRGDQTAIRQLAYGMVDAAGLGEFSTNLLPLDRRDHVVALAESIRIPSHCVVVRHDLDPALRQAFIDAMLKFNDPENRSLAAGLLGTEGYVPVTHDDYAAVEAMARKHGIIE